MGNRPDMSKEFTRTIDGQMHRFVPNSAGGYDVYVGGKIRYTVGADKRLKRNKFLRSLVVSSDDNDCVDLLTMLFWMDLLDSELYSDIEVLSNEYNGEGIEQEGWGVVVADDPSHDPEESAADVAHEESGSTSHQDSPAESAPEPTPEPVRRAPAPDPVPEPASEPSYSDTSSSSDSGGGGDSGGGSDD